MGYQECLVKNTPFFSHFILNSQFERNLKRFFPLHWGVVALRLRMCHFRQKSFLYSVYCSRQSKNYCALLPTSQDSSFYASIFLVSGKREGKKWRKTPNSVLLFSLFCCFRVWCRHVFLHSVSRLYRPGYSEQSTKV